MNAVVSAEFVAVNRVVRTRELSGFVESAGRDVRPEGVGVHQGSVIEVGESRRELGLTARPAERFFVIVSPQSYIETRVPDPRTKLGFVQPSPAPARSLRQRGHRGRLRPLSPNGARAGRALARAEPLGLAEPRAPDRPSRRPARGSGRRFHIEARVAVWKPSSRTCRRPSLRSLPSSEFSIAVQKASPSSLRRFARPIARQRGPARGRSGSRSGERWSRARPSSIRSGRWRAPPACRSQSARVAQLGVLALGAGPRKIGVLRTDGLGVVMRKERRVLALRSCPLQPAREGRVKPSTTSRDRLA